MNYSQSQIANLKAQIFSLINIEISLAIKNGGIEELAKKYGVELNTIPYLPSVSYRSKILIFGQLSGKIKDYQLAAKKMGIESKSLIFVTYKDVKNFDIERLKYSSEYSDIICGPMPHNIKGKGDFTSFIAEIEANPAIFPKLIKSISSNKLKITITSFNDALKRTRFYREVANA